MAGVEVSTDGGTSWHPAQGKQNWTYTYIQKGLATATIQVRAVDDSANIGAAVHPEPPAHRTVLASSASRCRPCRIPRTAAPTNWA